VAADEDERPPADLARAVIIKGKGVFLQMPALPVSEPVTVQLRNSVGSCWEAVYSAPSLKNDSTRYDDKSD
jgi:hypothetical protein